MVHSFLFLFLNNKKKYFIILVQKYKPLGRFKFKKILALKYLLNNCVLVNFIVFNVFLKLMKIFKIRSIMFNVYLPNIIFTID